jgi:hypothetical protein
MKNLLELEVYLLNMLLDTKDEIIDLGDDKSEISYQNHYEIMTEKIWYIINKVNEMKNQ